MLKDFFWMCFGGSVLRLKLGFVRCYFFGNQLDGCRTNLHQTKHEQIFLTNLKMY